MFAHQIFHIRGQSRESNPCQQSIHSVYEQWFRQLLYIRIVVVSTIFLFWILFSYSATISNLLVNRKRSPNIPLSTHSLTDYIELMYNLILNANTDDAYRKLIHLLQRHRWTPDCRIGWSLCFSISLLRHTERWWFSDFVAKFSCSKCVLVFLILQ